MVSVRKNRNVLYPSSRRKSNVEVITAPEPDPWDTVLIEELNHRLFNSFQIIVNLLEKFQNTARHYNRDSLNELQSRVLALAKLHRLLSPSSRFDRLEEHCRSLCRELVRAFGREDLMPDVRMADIQLPSQQCLSLELLVVELVTNALKHGPAHASKHGISVELAPSAEGYLELAVRDSREQSDPFLFRPRIVHALVESLSGTVTISADGGYNTRVRFPMSGL
jgi:two-component sensor histidine kinase